MEIISRLIDHRIESTNLMLEVTVRDYLDLIQNSLNNNEYQRRRVRSSNTVYSLLKHDFLEGCILPPVVLALRDDIDSSDLNNVNIFKELKTKANKIVILDGLQRTYSLIDLREDLSQNQVKLDKFLDQILRVEIYISINRIGILYRMLTLNTGQSPMSLRQQIEMLYLDLADTIIDGVKLVREVDDSAVIAPNEYSFRSMIDGYNSYIERNELPIDRFEILETIKGLKNLSSEKKSADLFGDFVSTYHSFVMKMKDLVGDVQFMNSADKQEQLLIQDIDIIYLNDSGQEFAGNPFGDSVFSIFSKSQSLTGFGAALGKLKDYETFHDFAEIKDIINNTLYSKDSKQAVVLLLQRLEAIRLQSKKIGNAQRLYFQFFFRELFNRNSDAFGCIEIAVTEAYKKYQSQVM